MKKVFIFFTFVLSLNALAFEAKDFISPIEHVKQSLWFEGVENPVYETELKRNLKDRWSEELESAMELF